MGNSDYKFIFRSNLFWLDYLSRLGSARSFSV